MSQPTSRVALVTGGNRGIGHEVCRQLARDHGYHVVLTARSQDKADEAAQALQGEGLDVTPLALDVTDADHVAEAKDTVETQFGRLDVLVNNAAINYDSAERAATVDLESVRKTLETNTLGAWRVAQALIPLLKQSAPARIVNVSSEAGSLDKMSGGTPAYRASKTALNAITRMLAAELKDAGILVNSVCPGWVRTEMGGSNAPRSIPEGAASVVWAATLGADGPTGGFYRDGQPLAW